MLDAAFDAYLPADVDALLDRRERPALEGPRPVVRGDDDLGCLRICL